MKPVKKYKKGGKTPVRKNVTRNLKKRDEDEIDRRYAVAVGQNPKTGKLNYPNSADMDKFDATAGSSGNPNKLRKAISDEYYAKKRKEMGIDKIKTYSDGGKGPGKKKKRKATMSAADKARKEKLEKIRENNRKQAEERAVRQRQGFAKRMQGKSYDGGALGGFTLQEQETLKRIKEKGMTKSLKK